MFAISERVRPCRLRWKPSSVGRSTRTTPSSETTVISGWTRWLSSPRGPLTVTTASSPTVTWTPLGISMGCLPIRLIVRFLLLPLPHVREDLAADALTGGVAVGHHPVRGGHDRDAEPAEDPRQPVVTRVDPPARLAHALQAADRAFALGAVLQRDAVDALDPLALLGVARDVPLGREDLQDRSAHLRRRDDELVLVRQVRVADPGQQVADGVVDVGREPHHDAFVTPGSSPACASSRKQIRHSMNRRYTARDRPQRRHRVYSRTLNLPCRSCLFRNAFFAMSRPRLARTPGPPGSPRRGTRGPRGAPCLRRRSSRSSRS